MDKNGHDMGGSAAQAGTADGTSTARKGRRTEKQRTHDLQASLPEGIQIGGWRDGRGKPFYVRWGHDRTVESFASEGDRNDAAEKLAGDREVDGTSVLDFDPKEFREWKSFRARCPAPLAELEVAWNERSTRRGIITADAAAKYLTLRLAEDIEEDSDTHRHIRLHLKRLCDAYGVLPLDDLTPDLIRELLEKLTSAKTGAPVGKQTKRHHRKDWNTFFKRCVAEDWMRKNPCAAVKAPRVEDEEKVPLTPREIFDLLKFNRDQPVVGRIAIELFGCLRAASAERLKKEDLKFDSRGIRMPGFRRDEATGKLRRNHKSRKTKFRQGHPPVLWEWLEHVSDDCWTKIDEGNYGHKKSEAFVRARVINPGNGLRDSAASYHLAVFKNPPLTAHLMQHKHMGQTETYEGIADEADGLLVMAMGPKEVLLTWEEFVAKVRKLK